MSGMTLAEFAEKVSAVMPVITREFVKQSYGDFSKLRVTMPQIFILNILEKEGEARMSDLAKFLRVSTASVTGVTDRLVRDAYVVRERGTKDRRVVKIKLTQKGSRLINTLNDKRKKVIGKVFGKLSGPDRASYLRILNQLKEGLEGA